MKIKISNEEIRDYLNVQPPEFPKYTTQIINLANQNAQGTRPKVVGQLSDLIQKFPGRSMAEWEEWYFKQNPDAIRVATDKILEMVQSLRDAMSKIDRDLVEQWVKDLVIVKTFIGLRFQEAILKRVSEIRRCDYRLATPEEEARGIDGYIGEQSVSIKPDTYKAKRSLSEEIAVSFVYYTKLKDGIEIEFEEPTIL
jgi:hypothetical protein